MSDGAPVRATPNTALSASRRWSRKPLVQENDDAAVRGRAGQQRQHGEQQKRRQRIALALRAPWIGNLTQRTEKPRERDHGNPHRSGIADRKFTYSPAMVDSFYDASYPVRTRFARSQALTGQN